MPARSRGTKMNIIQTPQAGISGFNGPVDFRSVAVRNLSTLEEVLVWPAAGIQGLTFRIVRQSQFGLLAEGAALAVLHATQALGIPIRLEAAFPILFTEGGRLDEIAPDILRSLFGCSAAYGSSSVTDGSGREVGAALVNALWRYVQDFGGEFGDGKKHSIIFRDPDYSIPHCLRSSPSVKDFPFPHDFSRVLRGLGNSILSRGSFGSLTEDELITFLYEAVRNSHDHAKYDSDGKPIRGIRGVTVEKFIFSSLSDVAGRPHIPSKVKDFLQRRWQNQKRHYVMIAFSVTDLGPGIHKTLRGVDGESDWERLNRAFLPGVSRKPTSDLSRGYGLMKILDAARRLNAFLFVRSAGLIGYRDFSVPGNVSKEPLLIPWELNNSIPLGSSLTLLWPMTKSSPDQSSLFGDLSG